MSVDDDAQMNCRAREDVLRRYLADELSLEEAAREFVRLYPGHLELFCMMWSYDTPPRDIPRLQELSESAYRIWMEMRENHGT
jgi:hypothetical protein